MASRKRRDNQKPNYIDAWGCIFDPVKGAVITKIVSMPEDDALELLQLIRKREKEKEKAQ